MGYVEEAYSAPFHFPAWDNRSTPPGERTVHWEIETHRGCIWENVTKFTVTDPFPGRIAPPDMIATEGSQCTGVSLRLINTSGRQLHIRRIVAEWT